jgi:hypothetical protein
VLNESVVDSFSVYNILTEKTNRLSSSPLHSRLGSRSIAVDKKIYYFGGSDKKHFGSNPSAWGLAVEVYDIEARTWTVLTTLPEPLFDFGLSLLGEWIYIFGGFTAQGEVNQNVFAYSTLSNSYMVVPMTNYRGLAQFGYATHNGFTFVTDGIGASGEPADVFAIVDFDTKKAYRMTSPGLRRRQGGHLLVKDNLIIASGGNPTHPNGVQQNDIELVNFDENGLIFNDMNYTVTAEIGEKRTVELENNLRDIVPIRSYDDVWFFNNINTHVEKLSLSLIRDIIASAVYGTSLVVVTSYGAVFSCDLPTGAWRKSNGDRSMSSAPKINFESAYTAITAAEIVGHQIIMTDNFLNIYSHDLDTNTTTTEQGYGKTDDAIYNNDRERLVASQLPFNQIIRTTIGSDTVLLFINEKGDIVTYNVNKNTWFNARGSVKHLVSYNTLTIYPANLSVRDEIKKQINMFTIH